MRVNYVEIPDGVSVSLDKNKVTIKGPKGEISRVFPSVELEQKENKVYVEGSKMMKGTVLAHLRNMVKGVTEGFEVKMKYLHAHFPVTIKVQGKEVIINNFIGEKKPRKAKIFGNVKVDVKGNNVTITGVNIEEVKQTAMNLKRATKIKDKDPRVFQDGFYFVE